MSYSNDLIYGKNKIENIVSVECDEDNLIVFQEKDGEITQQFLDNKYWILTHNYLNNQQEELEGKQYYKYMRVYDSLEEKNRGRQILRKHKIDFYDIWDPREASLVYNGMTYYKGLTPQDVSILFFDIETTGLTHDKNSKVLLISNTFRKNDKVIKKLFAYDDYENDADMFIDWCDWVTSCNPSIMCGHNIFGFDLPYMHYVAQNCGTGLYLGRDNSEIKFNNYQSKFRKDGSQDYEYFNCHIFGREIVDTMFLSIKYDIGRKYESYALKSIIAHEGLEKKDRQFYKAEDIRHNYKILEEWRKIKAYAIDDADDAMSLFDLMSPSFFYFNQSVSKTFQQMINGATGSQMNNIMVRSYLQIGHSIAKADDVQHFKGAISFGVPGVYSNAFKQDVSSLYPSIMRQYEIYNRYKDPNKHFIQVVEHFAIERLKNKKLAKETGNKYYKDMEQSQKIGANSLYGFLGAPGLNYNYLSGAELVTKKGREILSKAIEFATGHNVEYWENKAEMRMQ